MDCVNHPGEQATAYCQNCGKAMCAACTRPQAGGQILCEPCSMAWQSVQAPFTPAIPGAPNPVLATLLGFIPGVGAMYNGQFVKGFIHVAVFAVLVSISDHFGVFGIFVAAWIAYQVFDAHQTAKARRDGDPLPDPLGLNELAGWFHTGMQSEFRRAQGFPPPPVAGPTGGAAQQPHYAPPQAAPPVGEYVPPYQAPYSNPYQSGYQPPPFTGAPPAAGFTGYPPPPAAGFGPGYPAGYGQPMPPVRHWRRRPEPIAAIILIAMGVLFLLGQVSWLSGRLLEFSWPVMLIGLGAWLLFRRMNSPVPPLVGTGVPPAAPTAERAREDENDSRGGLL